MPAEEWEQLASAPAFEHPHFRVRRDTLRLPSGRVVDDYLVWDVEDYALIAATTAQGEVVLTRQWKQGVRRVTLELPGGKVDEGETPLEAAARELREETGYAAPELELLASLEVDPSKTMQRGHIVLARDAEPLHEPEEHEMESPDVVLVPLAEVASLIRSGKICAAASVAGLLLILERVG